MCAGSFIVSFGVILAEMTGGRHPFRRPSTMETFSDVLSEPPAIDPATPRGLASVLQQLLAKRADDRYPSMADVRAELTDLAVSFGSGWLPKTGRVAPAAWRWLAVDAVVVLVAATRRTTSPRG
jgi:serine/threonine protein kinase